MWTAGWFSFSSMHASRFVGLRVAKALSLPTCLRELVLLRKDLDCLLFAFPNRHAPFEEITTAALFADRLDDVIAGIDGELVLNLLRPNGDAVQRDFQIFGLLRHLDLEVAEAWHHVLDAGDGPLFQILVAVADRSRERGAGVDEGVFVFLLYRVAARDVEADIGVVFDRERREVLRDTPRNIAVFLRLDALLGEVEGVGVVPSVLRRGGGALYTG